MHMRKATRGFYFYLGSPAVAYLQLLPAVTWNPENIFETYSKMRDHVI
jgi:hypothetical protein